MGQKDTIISLLQQNGIMTQGALAEAMYGDKRYFSDITKGRIQRWQDTFNYSAYNDYITQKLDELGITTPYRKRKFDHFVWYKNR